MILPHGQTEAIAEQEHQTKLRHSWLLAYGYWTVENLLSKKQSFQVECFICVIYYVLFLKRTHSRSLWIFETDLRVFTFVHSHVQILNLRCLCLVLSFPNWFKWVSYPAALCYTRCRIAFCHLISPLANPENPLWPETIYTIAVFSLDAFERLPSRCFTTVGHTRARILPLMFKYNKTCGQLIFHTSTH